LYEGTIALSTGVDFGKGLGRSEPWGNYALREGGAVVA